MTDRVRNRAALSPPSKVRKKNNLECMALRFGINLRRKEQHPDSTLAVDSTYTTPGQKDVSEPPSSNESDAQRIARQLVGEFLTPSANISRIFFCW